MGSIIRPRSNDDRDPDIWSRALRGIQLLLVDAPPARYLERISYGLYLWHVLLIRFDGPIILAVGASVVVADLSYRFVELPLLRAREPTQSDPN